MIRFNSFKYYIYQFFLFTFILANVSADVHAHCEGNRKKIMSPEVAQ